MYRPSQARRDRNSAQEIRHSSKPSFGGTVFSRLKFGVSALALFAVSSVPLTLSLQPASAFELFGFTLFGEKEDQSDPVPDPIAYETTLTVEGENDLTAGLKASSLLVSREEQRPSGRSGLISRGIADLDRLISRLYTTGHYGGTVDIKFNGTALQTALETGEIPGARPVAVTITVDPGPQFTFGDIDITASGEAGTDLSNESGSWGLISGTPAKSGEILTAENRIVSVLRTRGFPNAKITNRDIVADHATNKLDVNLTVDTGHKARFGAVTVSGTKVTDPNFVARQAMIPEGETYSPEELEKARARLNALGIFSSIRLVEGTVSGPDGTLPIAIEVSERKRHVIGAGATWSSSEGFGLEGYWRRRNLFGQGELLSVEGSVGRIGNANLQAMEYSTRIAFEKPGVFGPTTKFTTSLGAKQETPDAYTSRSVTYDAYLVHDFNEQLSGRAGAKVFYSQEDDVFGENEYLLVSLPTDFTFDNRDDKLNPSKGIFASAALEPAYDTLNSNAMVFIKATVSSYIALDEAKRFILAGKISGGSILGPSIEDIPASQRFIAGGGGSIRGYAYRNVGPRKDGEITGGRSLLEVSGEVRVRLTDTIGMVGFVDAGNAYADSTPNFSKPLKIGVGAGLRYFTPIGPLRIDAAVPLDPEQDDPDFALYVGLSQAF